MSERIDRQALWRLVYVVKSHFPFVANDIVVDGGLDQKLSSINRPHLLLAEAEGGSSMKAALAASGLQTVFAKGVRDGFIMWSGAISEASTGSTAQVRAEASSGVSPQHIGTFNKTFEESGFWFCNQAARLAAENQEKMKELYAETLYPISMSLQAEGFSDEEALNRWKVSVGQELLQNASVLKRASYMFVCAEHAYAAGLLMVNVVDSWDPGTPARWRSALNTAAASTRS